ncbi:MAG: ribonuclease PH [Lentisphaerae bacterium GWF2_44_16]|nr:MAG: ribonuclease PH [Lentisphaerae bacterium GWF2_44_16]
MKRFDGRKPEQLRKIKVTKNFLNHPIASVLIEVGGTKVICSVALETGVPPWMRAQNVPGGWVTSEYGMLPSSTQDRMRREATQGKQGGRTMEIQRLIGRSFRSVIDLRALGTNTIYIDCDVIDADGGTRCASICGASIALQMAFQRMIDEKRISVSPMRESVAAVSVGILKGEPLLDLCYEEDSAAEVDMNVVMTESGKFVEVQGTAEENPFSKEELDKMLLLAKNGLDEIFQIQKNALGTEAKKAPDGKFGNLGELLNEVKL